MRSRMLSTCGLLLVLSVLIIYSNCGTDEKYAFILGTDGFTGFLKLADSSSCKSGYFASLRSKYNECTTNGSYEIFNISVADINENGSYPTRVDGDFNVSFTRESPYKLNISRESIPAFVCFFERRCRPEILRKWITEDCKTAFQNTKHFQNNTCNVTCFDPEKTCKKASYNPDCSDADAGSKNKVNSFEISNKSATCFKCGSAFQVLSTINIGSNSSKMFNTKETDAGAAVETMKSLSSVLDLMGNESAVAVSMGSVTGILQKIEKESEIKESAFIYSPNTGIRLIDDVDELKNYPNVLIVPKEAAQKAFNSSAGKAFLGVFRFPNMTKDANNSTVLGDEVYAIEMGAQISNLNHTINLGFKKNEEVQGTLQCHSWDGNGSKPNWTTEGCTTVVDEKTVTCKCEHLTFFAVLMSPPGVQLPAGDVASLTFITYIGCGLSMFFLGIGLFMHFLINKKKATKSVFLLINLFVALFMLNLTFLINEYVARANNFLGCRVMAGFMHYSLLASFTWFGVEALHLCLQMAKSSVSIKHYIIKIAMVGWVPPALIVSIIFLLGEYGEQTIQTESNNMTMCWILDSTVHYYVNIGYYCFIFIFTFTTFIVVLRWLSMLKLNKWSNAGQVQRSGIASSDITTILALCCLLGLTWSISFFSYGVLQIPSYYIFTILNSLQGFFLFIYYLKTSALFGDKVTSESSDSAAETKTENPYDDTTAED